MTRCPWPSFHAPPPLLKFYVEPRNKGHFFVAVIALGMKHCIVIVLDTLFEHTPWPGALDLHFTLHWLCRIFMSSLEKKVHFSAAAMAVSMKPCIVVVLDTPTMTFFFCLTYISHCCYFTKCRCDIDLRGVLVLVLSAHSFASKMTTSSFWIIGREKLFFHESMCWAQESITWLLLAKQTRYWPS